MSAFAGQDEHINPFNLADFSAEMSSPFEIATSDCVDNTGFGYVDLPTLHQLQASISEMLTQLDSEASPFEPEISEPLRVVLQDEIQKIGSAILAGLRK